MRVYKNGTCSCWTRANQKLKKHNTTLSYSFTFSGKTLLNVATEKIDFKEREGPKMIVASYCPFCGTKLK